MSSVCVLETYRRHFATIPSRILHSERWSFFSKFPYNDFLSHSNTLVHDCLFHQNPTQHPQSALFSPTTRTSENLTNRNWFRIFNRQYRFFGQAHFAKRWIFNIRPRQNQPINICIACYFELSEHVQNAITHVLGITPKNIIKRR